MQRIIFATTNENKMKEIREILSDFPVEIFSLQEAGIKADIDENGSSFEENAAIKAEAIEKMTGAIVLADDSGLEIDYLNGEPGIYSARYMGEETSYHVKNAHLIERLKGVPDEQRTARFVCCVAAAFPDREIPRGSQALCGNQLRLPAVPDSCPNKCGTPAFCAALRQIAVPPAETAAVYF